MSDSPWERLLTESDLKTWNARLDAIEAKVDMILALLHPTRGLSEAEIAAADAQIHAQRAEMLELLSTDPIARCKCGKARYIARDGAWHCDYCEGVPKREFTDGGMPHVFQVPTATPSPVGIAASATDIDDFAFIDDDPGLLPATVGDICRLEAKLDAVLLKLGPTYFADAFELGAAARLDTSIAAKLDELLALLRTDGEAAPSADALIEWPNAEAYPFNEAHAKVVPEVPRRESWTHDYSPAPINDPNRGRR